jgi:energy-coupling factor transporter transmembrane protein EcfT
VLKHELIQREWRHRLGYYLAIILPIWLVLLNQPVDTNNPVATHIWACLFIPLGFLNEVVPKTWRPFTIEQIISLSAIGFIAGYTISVLWHWRKWTLGLIVLFLFLNSCAYFIYFILHLESI